MDAKSEKQAEESRLRHEMEFRNSHNISDDEWDLADAMAAELQNRLFTRFWELYDGDHRE